MHGRLAASTSSPSQLRHLSSRDRKRAGHAQIRHEHVRVFLNHYHERWRQRKPSRIGRFESVVWPALLDPGEGFGKHAEASEVRIDMAIAMPALRIAIADNGKGFDPAAVRPGRNGLGNMCQRLAEIGGHCEISSQPGAGTRVEMEITLKPGPER